MLTCSYLLQAKMSPLENHEKLDQIRDGLPNVKNKVFANTGSTGPLSLAAIKAIENELALLNDKNYVGKPFFRNFEILKKTRETLSRLINSEADEVVITNSTTNGIYDTIYSLNWSVGDEVITTDKEHFAVNIPLLLIREKFGVEIKYFNIKEDYLTELTEKITPKTKLIVVSHVSYATGEVLPVKEIIRVAHTHNIPVLIDGAQSVGAIPVDVRELEVDYYSFPAQKWLNGPQGTGALYVNKKIINDYHPDVNKEESPYPYQDIKLRTDANRFQPSLPSSIVSAAFEASVGWLIDRIGTDFAFGWIQELSIYLKTGLSEIEGVTVVTPVDAAGLTSFYTDFIDTKTLNEYLTLHGVLARTIRPFDYVRVSTSYFNTKQEIDILLKLIKTAREKGGKKVSSELKKQFVSKYANDTKFLELVTVNEEGFPVIRSLGSFGVDGYYLYLSTGKTSQKVSQIANNDKVAILLQQEGQEISKYVNIAYQGTAKLLQDPEKLQEAITVIASHSPGYEERVKASGVDNLAIYQVKPSEIKILDFSKNHDGKGVEIITEFA